MGTHTGLLVAIHQDILIKEFKKGQQGAIYNDYIIRLHITLGLLVTRQKAKALASKLSCHPEINSS
eukprot:1154968-Pelagomonas_calceolata.AAC.1